MRQPLKVLIAEDNASDAELLVRELWRGGFDCEWHRVDNEADFLARLDGGLDLVISDYEMPQFGGLRALELLNRSELGIPFIIVSGTIGEEMAVAAMKRGASDYLLKDRLTRLGPAVEHVVAQAKLRREQQRAEQAKAVAEAKYRSIFDNSVEGLYQTTPEGRLLIANPALAKIAGYESAEAMIAAVTDVGEQFYVFPAERARFRAQMQAEGEVHGFETQMRRRDGTLFWISSDARMIRDEAGHVCYEGALQDITERKRAEQALRASEIRFRSTLEGLIEGCVILSREWRFLYVNDAAARFCRQPVAALEGRPITAIFPDFESTPMFAMFRQCMDERIARKMEAALRYADGTSAWFQLVTQPVPEGLFVLSLDISERKRADEELQWKTAFLEAQVNSSVDGILVVSPEGRKNLQNRQMVDLFKIPPHIADDTDDAPQLRWVTDMVKEPEAFAARTADLVAHPAEISRDEIELKNGTVLDRYSAPVIGKDGRNFGRVWTFRDITERRRATAALRQSELFLQSTLNALTSAVVVLDETGTIKITNETWRRVARENGSSDYLNRNYLTVCDTSANLLGSAEARAAAEGIRGVLSGAEQEFRLECACHSPGEKRWFLMHVSPLGDGQRGAVVAHENITGLKLAEVGLRASEERFRGLIENASDVITLLDAAGLIRFLSPSTQRVLGHEPGDLLGHSVMEFIHPEDRVKAGQGIQRSIGGATIPVPVEYRIRHRDGTWRIFQSIGRSMEDAAAPGDRLVVVNSRDITETRKLEEQFLRAQRLESIGTLASGIAHDLNNILSPMLMAAGLLRSEVPDGADNELLNMIVSSAQRGASIIRQLLTFSRGIEGERVAVQFRHIVKETAEIVRETFPRNITVTENVARDLHLVSADATQMHQVLMNLCVNARDAMPDGGVLRLTAENVELTEATREPHPDAKLGPYVRAKVSDTGQGMPAAIIERIFDPFFTTKGVGKGTGLGLSTVLGIVKSHGGFVTVKSTPGAGSEFAVFLPVTLDAPSPEALHLLPEAPRGGGQLVLVVDDEGPIRIGTRQALEQWGYRVLLAADGEEALTAVRLHRSEVRAVVADLMMPVLGGLGLVKALRAEAPELRVVLMSGMVADEERVELRALGLSDVLVKPFGPDELLMAVAGALAGGAKKA